MAQSHYLAVSKTLLMSLWFALLVWLAAPQQLHSLPLTSLTRYSCSIDASGSGSNTFRIYLPSDWHAQQLADELCQSNSLSANYHQVEINWQPREQLTPNGLLQHPYQLIWSRHHAIQGLLPDYQQHYQPHSEMPAYRIYWYSHQPEINLHAEALSRLSIGLLDDSKSYSGYLAAMAQLSQASIPPEQLDIHYFPSRAALLQGFLTQQVDLIPGLDAYPQLSAWPPSQKQLITEQAPMGRWYMHQSLAEAEKTELKHFLHLYWQQLQRKMREPRESL